MNCQFVTCPVNRAIAQVLRPEGHPTQNALATFFKAGKTLTF